MADVKTTQQVRVADIIQRYGRCLELVTMDPNFHEITVGLHEMDGTLTLWTYSRKPGVESRIEKIRDQLVALGEMVAVDGTHDQARLPCGQAHRRPLKFLMIQAVEKDPAYTLPEGRVKDLRSPLMLGFDASEEDGRWVYRVTSEGEAPDPAARRRAVTGGFVRYGEMEKVGDDAVSFPCGQRHDGLVTIVLPYARNVGQAEDMLAADALRTQMTTSTLGFAPPA